MTKLIAVFNKDLSVGSFLNFSGEKVSAEFIDETVRENVEKFLNFLEKNQPKIKKEVIGEDGHERILFLESVEKNDPRYPDALAFELNQRGFLSAVIPESLKDILLLLSRPQFSFKEREKIMGNLLNSSPKEMEEVGEMAEDAAKLAQEVKTNREEWEEFLNQKKKNFKPTGKTR